MAHREQQEFCEWVKSMHPQFFNNRTVIDVGSKDINGNNRYLFHKCRYTGIDLSAGKNVDVVGHATSVLQPDCCDVVISTEALEHDKHWRLTLLAMHVALRKGGLMLITAGGDGRPEHGTTRCVPSVSPDTNDHYENISNFKFSSVLTPSLFRTYYINQDCRNNDFQFFGILR